VPGTAYLKYLESASALVFVLRFAEGIASLRRCAAQYEFLLGVCHNREGFSGKKRIIALNHFVKENCFLGEFGFHAESGVVVPVNALNGEGLSALVTHISSN
jgi:hypothetical protein